MRLRHGLTLALAIVFSSSGCSSSPTEPSSGPGPGASSLAIEVTSLPVFGASGAISVENSTCTCTSSALSISVNDQEVGTVSCGMAGSFVTPVISSQFTVRARSSNGQSVSLGFVTVNGASGAPSLSIRVRCL
jgi:hypothetical protein